MTCLCADRRQVAPAAVAAQIRCFADSSVRFAVSCVQIEVAEDQEFCDFGETQLMNSMLRRQRKFDVGFEGVSDEFLLSRIFD